MKNYRGTSSYNSISPTAGYLSKPKLTWLENLLDLAGDFFGKIGAGVLEFLLDNSEIKIVEKTDRDGNLIWEVYDKVRDRRSTFYSEEEVRIWLDNRYYL